MLSYDSWLVAYANARLEAAEADLASAPPEVPVEATLTYLRAQIAGRVEYWKAEARRHRAEQARYLAEQETQAQAPFAIPSSAPSSDVISRRKSWLKKYRSEKELSAEAFARKVGISETAIRGIVKEDRSRFADATRNKLLDVLGISLREWYGP
jgi:ribosome-binding protein aMBF1 (putative translation factor)